ncbi:MAG: SecB chaperone [Jatrophihabitantaceae bacterium]
MTEAASSGRDLRALAARLAARSEIRDIRMFRSSFELMGIPLDDDQLNYTLEVSNDSIERNSANTAFVVRITYRLRLERSPHDDSEEEKSVKIAKVKFTLAGFFQLVMREGDELPTEEEFEAYSVTTAAFALYPFAREYSYDVTHRMRLPPLTLGVFTQPITRQEALGGAKQ